MKNPELEYKNYSLEKMSEFIQDALQTEATPIEIYNTIITTLKKEVDYHDVCKRQAQNILDLMQGHRKIDSIDLGLDEYPYRESFISALSTEDDTISLEFTENNEGDVINFPKRY
jgi:hypothetical protein|tara:strand:- start:1793 stop:2137 length:345 start_codon:yes stop_codon:yes gene_type:complete